MHSRARTPSIVGRSSIVVALVCALAVLGGCGSTLRTAPAASVSGVFAGSPPDEALNCPATVLKTLGHVLDRVYREGVISERTASARALIGGSAPLRAAVESGNATAARAAAEALLATGHMTNLEVMRGTQPLVNLGGPALAPLQGTLTAANGAPIGSYISSVWSDSGFITEAHGVTEGVIDLRSGGEHAGGADVLPAGSLAAEGTFTRDGAAYQFTSFPVSGFPAGAPLQLYLVRSVPSTASLCGASNEATLINTLTRIANLIYQGEAGRRTITQIERVQSNTALLEAVAHRDPAATRAAIFGLLNHHIVRMRVSAGDGKLLSDVGGPYVLAPVSAPLRLDGHPIGSFVLSIQDDEGYLRLTRRLAGLKVLMYMNPDHPQLVKNSLGPAPGNVPASGAYEYRGQRFQVFTVNARAFPSGQLTIRVLIPIPYS